MNESDSSDQRSAPSSSPQRDGQPNVSHPSNSTASGTLQKEPHGGTEVVDALKGRRTSAMIDRLHDMGISAIRIAKSGPMVAVSFTVNGKEVRAQNYQGDISGAIEAAGVQAAAIRAAVLEERRPGWKK